MFTGLQKASYQTVEIPVIMPKPDLMALTGGYRKPGIAGGCGHLL